MNHYLRFALMMATSFVLMYAIMYLNADQFDHVMLSVMRTYMALLMVTSMAVVMLGYMWSMYKNTALNITIMAGAAIAFVAVFVMVRQQAFISDVQYMKAMIPHHSSAILTSQEAHLTDPEVIRLSEEIIKAQKEEIAEMKQLIKKLEGI